MAARKQYHRKQLKFTYEGKEYTLEYTRRTVREMEQSGFVVANIEKQPFSCISDLFAGAFLSRHRNVSQRTINDIYNHMTNKEGLIEALTQMYTEPIQSLVDEPEDSEKNVTWTVSQ